MNAVANLGVAKCLKPSIMTIAKTVFGSLLLVLCLNSAYAQTATTDDKTNIDDMNAALNQAIHNCARPKLHFAYRQENLSAQYEISVDENLRPTDAKITHASGEKAFDRAVIDALQACAEYPEALRNSTFNGVFNYTR